MKNINRIAIISSVSGGVIAALLAQALYTSSPACGQTMWNLKPQSHAAGNLLETTKQARERHSAERYEYQQRYINRTGGYSTAPLGGYAEPLGSPAPYGTANPGYVMPKGYGHDQ